MHGSVHGCMGVWLGDVEMGVGKMKWYTTWIGEVGLGHWGRSGLGGDVAVEEGFGGVSECETENKCNKVNNI